MKFYHALPIIRLRHSASAAGNKTSSDDATREERDNPTECIIPSSTGNAGLAPEIVADHRGWISTVVPGECIDVWM